MKSYKWYVQYTTKKQWQWQQTTQILIIATTTRWAIFFASTKGIHQNFFQFFGPAHFFHKSIESKLAFVSNIKERTLEQFHDIAELFERCCRGVIAAQSHAPANVRVLRGNTSVHPSLVVAVVCTSGFLFQHVLVALYSLFLREFTISDSDLFDFHGCFTYYAEKQKLRTSHLFYYFLLLPLLRSTQKFRMMTMMRLVLLVRFYHGTKTTMES